MMLTLLALVSLIAGAAATHSEELYVRPLPHSKSTLAHFHFSTEEPSDATLSESVYPKVIRQILTKYDAASIQLSFAVGEYSEARHGPPSKLADDAVQGGVGKFHAPFGAQLQVEFIGSDATLMDRWRGVTSELGGIFSASLNQMKESTVITTSDRGLAREFGMLVNSTKSSAQTTFFQAALAREELCTENLTPWLKMLPCRSHEGLGALVDPIKILSGQFAMISVSASRGHGQQPWRFDQRLTTIQGSGAANQAPPSLKSLLLDPSTKAAPVVSACPLAQASGITTEGNGLVTTTDLKTAKDGVSTSESLTSQPLSTYTKPVSVASVHRFQTGFGQVHGGIAVRLENRHPSCAMTVTYNDVSPWFIRLYSHTFQSRLDSLDGGHVAGSGTPVFTFVPAELRGRPNQFRVQVDLPPQSALLVSMQFEKVFIRLSEHPPDANRGFDIPAGVATFTSHPSEQCSSPVSRLVYSEPLLVALPTPDFSMPYNVITLSSTVVAFFVGSMLNTLLRRARRIQRILAEDPKP